MRLRSLAIAAAVFTPLAAYAADTYLLQSRGAKVPVPPGDPLEDAGLSHYPPCVPGLPNPPDLEKRGGREGSSYASVELPGNISFEEWMAKMRRQRPAVDAAQRKLLEQR